MRITLAARTEKHRDGLWHRIPDNGLLTVCGRVREPQGKGRPGQATCPTCTRGVLPVAVLPAVPSVRPDGRCIVCRKPRQTERSRRYARGAADRDPFCSSPCARLFYGNPVPVRSIWGQVA